MADLARIKRNVGRMLDQGAPEADIDAYLGSEGVSPEQLRAPAAPEKAAAPAAPTDPYRTTVRKEIDDLRAKGVPVDAGRGRLALQGMTLNAADEILAGMMTPIEMIRRGTLSPVEGYNYAKAREDLTLEDAREKGGVLGTAMEIGGGFLSGTNLLRAGQFGTGLLARTGSTAAEGALLGGVAGALDGSGTEDRLTKAGTGAALGGTVGAVLPTAGAIAKGTVGRVVSMGRALHDPAGYAQRQIGRALEDSGRGADDVAGAVAQAADEGQDAYRLVDALGNAGRRTAAVVAKNPGRGREELTEFLDSRQAGQAERLVNAIEEGLAAPQTAEQTRAALTTARNQAADAAYGQARADAASVDVSGAIRAIDETLAPGVMGQLNRETGLSDDTVEAALARARRYLTDGDSILTDFAAVQRTMGDIGDMADAAARAGRGNQARLLGQVRRELDQALEHASASYAGARNAYRTASREIDAVDVGAAAALRGRSEDVIGAYGRLAPGEQAAFRPGYADTVIRGVQRAAEGANKARPLTSAKMQAELPAVAAPGRGEELLRRIGRENEMFATRAKATGGSATAENLSDNAAMGIDPGILLNLVTGRVGTAAGQAVQRVGAGLSGNTEAVRTELARLLQMGAGDDIRSLLRSLAADTRRRAERGRGVQRGLLAATVVPANQGLLSRR